MSGQLANYTPNPFYLRVRTPVTIEEGAGWDADTILTFFRRKYILTLPG